MGVVVVVGVIQVGVVVVGVIQVGVVVVGGDAGDI